MKIIADFPPEVKKGQLVCMDLRLGDCLDLLPTLPDKSIDAIITDVPYGTTSCRWDTVIPLDPMWKEVKRLLKCRGVFVTTSSQPFTSVLVTSNMSWFRYEWVWIKSRASNVFARKHQPLKFHENVVVFSGLPAHNSAKNTCNYYPQMETRRPENSRRNAPKTNTKRDDGVYGKSRIFSDPANGFSEYTFPKSFLFIKNRDSGLHPTQKPLALYEYLVRTYTNSGDTVLDFCMGSGTTGVACKNLSRNFIGIESDPKYFETAKNRILAVKQPENSQEL